MHIESIYIDVLYLDVHSRHLKTQDAKHGWHDMAAKVTKVSTLRMSGQR